MNIYDYTVKNANGQEVSLVISLVTKLLEQNQRFSRYTYLKSQQKGTLGSKIKWNFTKFLVDRNGNVVARFAPTTTPEKLEEEVAKLLK